MGWQRRLIGDAALAPYMGSGEASTLRASVAALRAQQRDTWPLLRAATTALGTVQYRHFQINGAAVMAQYNPQRLVSTAARVDAASIRARPCFLCADHLPPEEQGIAFGADFVILCNPFPVLSDHLVIVARRHTPQAIEGSFETLLDVAAALGPDYCTLYNGPACGASAPDHLHVQACARAPLPLVREVESWPRQQGAYGAEREVFALADYRLHVLVARGKERSSLMQWWQQTLAAFTAVTPAAAPEPLLNLLVTFDHLGWTVYLFPRAQHRPSCYYAEDETKLTVSPAAIDLAGVLVLPEADHFARLSGPDIARIYAEVTLDTPRFTALKEMSFGHYGA